MVKHKNKFIALAVGILMISGFFALQQAQAGTIYPVTIPTGSFERKVELSTYLYDEAGNQLLSGFDYRINHVLSDSNMGKTPVDNNAVVSLAQGDIVKIKFRLYQVGSNTNSNVRGKAKFFSNTIPNTNLLGEALIPLGSCDKSVTSDPTCTVDLTNNEISFGGFNGDMTPAHDYELTFLVGEYIESPQDIYMRVDYTADNVQTGGGFNDLNIANGSCGLAGVSKSNPSSDPMAPCMTTPPTGTQGYMNFKFEVTDTSAPELYLLPNTTVGYPDFRDGIEYQAVGFNDQDTWPSFTMGNAYPTSPPVFDAGVVFDNQITLNTKAMFTGKDPLSVQPADFRDDQAVAFYMCDVTGAPTCSPITYGVTDPQGTVVPVITATPSDPILLPSGPITTTVTGFLNSTPLVIDISAFQNQGINKKFKLYLVPLDYSNNVFQQPLAYSFKTPEPPEWYTDFSINNFSEKEIVGGTHTILGPLTNFVNYYRTAAGTLVHADIIVFSQVSTGGACTGNISIDRGNLIITKSDPGQYLCHGTYTTNLTVQDNVITGTSATTKTFSILDTPAFKQAIATIGTSSQTYNQVNNGIANDAGTLSENVTINLAAKFHNYPDGGDIFIIKEGINTTMSPNPPVVSGTGLDPRILNLTFSNITSNGGDSSTNRYIKYFALRENKLAEDFDRLEPTINCDPNNIFPVGENFYADFTGQNPSAYAISVAQCLITYKMNHEITDIDGSFIYKFRLASNPPALNTLHVSQMSIDDCGNASNPECTVPGSLKYTFTATPNSGGTYNLSTTNATPPPTNLADWYFISPYTFGTGTSLYYSNTTWKQNKINGAFTIALKHDGGASNVTTTAPISIDYEPPTVTITSPESEIINNVPIDISFGFAIKDVNPVNASISKQYKYHATLLKWNGTTYNIPVGEIAWSPAWLTQTGVYTKELNPDFTTAIPELDYGSQYKLTINTKDYFGNSFTKSLEFTTEHAPLEFVFVKENNGTLFYDTTNPLVISSGAPKDLNILGQFLNNTTPYNLLNNSNYQVNYFYSECAANDIIVNEPYATNAYVTFSFDLHEVMEPRSCDVTATATHIYDGNDTKSKTFTVIVNPPSLVALRIIDDDGNVYTNSDVINLTFEPDLNLSDPNLRLQGKYSGSTEFIDLSNSDGLSIALLNASHNASPTRTQTDAWDEDLKNLNYIFYENFAGSPPYYPPYNEEWKISYNTSAPSLTFNLAVSLGEPENFRLMKKNFTASNYDEITSGTDVLQPNTYNNIYRLEASWDGENFVPLTNYTIALNPSGTTTTASVRKKDTYDYSIDTKCPGTLNYNFKYNGDPKKTLLITVAESTSSVPSPLFIPNRTQMVIGGDIDLSAYVPQQQSCPIDIDSVVLSGTRIDDANNTTSITSPNPTLEEGIYTFLLSANATGSNINDTYVVKLQSTSGANSSDFSPDTIIAVDKKAPVISTVTYNNGKAIKAEIDEKVTKFQAIIDENYHMTDGTTTVTERRNVSYTMRVENGDKTISIVRNGVTSDSGRTFWTIGTPLPTDSYTLTITAEDTAGNSSVMYSYNFSIDIDDARYVGSFTSMPLSPASKSIIDDDYNNIVSIAMSLFDPNGVTQAALLITDNTPGYLEGSFDTTGDFAVTNGAGWDVAGYIVGNEGTVHLSAGEEASATIVYSDDPEFEKTYHFAFALKTGGTGVTYILQPCESGGSCDETWPYDFTVSNARPARPMITFISGVPAAENAEIEVKEPEESLTPLFRGKFENDNSVAIGSKIALTVELCEPDGTCNQIPPQAYKLIMPYGTDFGITSWEWNYTLSNSVYPLYGNSLYEVTVETIGPNGEKSSPSTYKFRITPTEYDPSLITSMRTDPNNPDLLPDIEPVLADGQETYDLQVQIRDKFGNYIDTTSGSDNDTFEFDVAFPVEEYDETGTNPLENQQNIFEDYRELNINNKDSALRLKDSDPVAEGFQEFTFDEELGLFVGKIASLAPSVDVRPFISDVTGQVINPELGNAIIRDLDVKLSLRVTSENVSRDTANYHDADADSLSHGTEVINRQYFEDAGLITGGADFNCQDILSNVSSISDPEFINNYSILPGLDPDSIEQYDPYEICVSLQDIGEDTLMEATADTMYRQGVPIVQQITGPLDPIPNEPTGNLIFSPYWAYRMGGNYEYIPAVKFTPLLDMRIQHLLYKGHDEFGNEIWEPEELLEGELLTLYQQATVERFRVNINNKSDTESVYFGDSDLGVEALLKFVENTASFEDMHIVDNSSYVKPIASYDEVTDQYTYSASGTWIPVVSYISQEGAELLSFKNINNSLQHNQALSFDFTAKPALTNPGILSSEGLIESDVFFQIARAEYLGDFIRIPGKMLGLNIIRTDINLDIAGYADTSDDDTRFGQYTISDILDIMEQRVSSLTRIEGVDLGESRNVVNIQNDPIIFTDTVDFDTFSDTTYAFKTNDGTVLYVTDANVILESSTDGSVTLPGGARTIIIDGGNLIVKNNLLYADITETFGFIVVPKRYDFNGDTQPIIPQDPLLETSYNEAIAGGSVFVSPEVTDIEANFFIQGAIFNYDQFEANLEDRLADVSSVYDVLIGDDNAIPVVELAVPTLRHQLYIRGVLVALHNTMGGLAKNEPFEQITDAEDYNKKLDFALFRIFSLNENDDPREFLEQDTGETLESEFSEYCNLEENRDPLNPVCERAVIIDRGVFKAPPGFDLPPDVSWTEISGY